MAQSLIIFIATASAVGVSFLVLFSLLARREHRLKTTRRHVGPQADGPPHCSSRIAAVALILAAVLAGLSLLMWRSHG
jgi:hypothetical protein